MTLFYGRHAVPLRTYKLSTETFIGEIIKLFFVSMIVFMASLVFSGIGTYSLCSLLLRLEGEKMDAVFPIVFFGIFLTVLSLGWMFMRRYFQFSIHIYKDHLQTHALWFRNHLGTEEV